MKSYSFFGWIAYNSEQHLNIFCAQNIFHVCCSRRPSEVPITNRLVAKGAGLQCPPPLLRGGVWWKSTSYRPRRNDFLNQSLKLHKPKYMEIWVLMFQNIFCTIPFCSIFDISNIPIFYTHLISIVPNIFSVCSSFFRFRD